MRIINDYWHKRLFCGCGWNKLVTTLDLRIALSGMAVCPKCGADKNQDVWTLKTVRKVYKCNWLTHLLHSAMMWDLKYTFEEKK
jgi:hypothetical protein